MIQSSRSTLLVAAVVFLGFSGGCGGAKEADAKTATADGLPTAIEHEACDLTSSSAQKLDTNGDGKPDIVRVMSGGHEVCRMVDLNHDDRPDSYIYFDAQGNIRRRESDFDRDGRIDEIATYSGGVIARKDRETNLDGKLDTWDFYVAGKIDHRMRDSDGDGKVDQWWTWPNPDKPDCAIIASDHSGDGKPDPNNIVDVCSLNGTPGAVDAGSATSATAEAGATLAAASASDGSSTTAATPPMPPAPALADAGVAATSSKDAGVSTSKKVTAKGKKEAK